MLYNQKGLEDFHISSFKLHLAFFETVGNEKNLGLAYKDQLKLGYEKYKKDLAATTTTKNPFVIEKI